MSTTRRAYNLLRGYVNREWDRIQGVELNQAQVELGESLQAPALPAPKPRAAEVSNEAKAQGILGVAPTDGFEHVRRTFERLNRRSDPANFPAGSVERERAASIQKSVQWAYGILSKDVNPVEKRFRSLEID